MSKFSFTRMPDRHEYCTCCERELKSECAMLELNTRTHVYSDGGVPEEDSQGWFPFGKACADRVIKNGGRF